MADDLDPPPASKDPSTPTPRSGRLLHAGKKWLRWEHPDATGIRGALQRAARRYLDWNRELVLDPWLRYSAVVPFLEETEGLATILDVGSGSFGLASVLRKPVISVDIRFPTSIARGPRSSLLPVIANVARLPFRDSSFDAVVSMDLVEHLPKAIRTEAVHELFRVASDLVVIGFPFGEASARFDEWALALERNRGIPPAWREEHVRHGVPGTELESDILDAARKYSRGASVQYFGHESMRGLRLRWKLQSVIGKDSRLYGLVFAPLYWIHARGHPKRAYRRVFVIRLGASQQATESIPVRRRIR